MDAHDEVVRETVRLGFPAEFGEVVAAELATERSQLRMASYLRQAAPRTMEEVADEMLAITAERDSWVERKLTERAQDSFNRFMREHTGEDAE